VARRGIQVYFCHPFSVSCTMTSADLSFDPYDCIPACKARRGAGLLVDSFVIRHTSFVRGDTSASHAGTGTAHPKHGMFFPLMLVDNFIHLIIKTRHHHVKDINHLSFYVKRFPRFCLCSLRSACCPQTTALENDFESYGFAWRRRQVRTYCPRKSASRSQR
jgi:hypothetical protein